MKIRSWIALLIIIALSLSGLVMAQGDREVITPDNARSLTELMRLGRGTTDSVKFSPDGEIVAVGGSVGVWLYPAAEIGTESEPPVVLASSNSKAFTFTPDGNLIVGNLDGLTLYDTTSLEALRNVAGQIRFVEISPDGTRIAVNGQRFNEVLIADVATGEQLFVLPDHTRTISSVAFSPDSSLLVSGAEDNSVRMWSMTDGSSVAVMEGHTNRITDVYFSSDGSAVVSSDSGGQIRIWDAASGAEIAMLQAEDARNRTIYAMALSPDDSQVAVAYGDSIIRIWDLLTGEIALIIEANADTPSDLAFSPDGSVLVITSSTGNVKMFDATGAELAVAQGHTRRMTSVAFSPEGERLILGSSGGIAWLWDVNGMGELNTSPRMNDATSVVANNTTSVAFSPDGTMAATVGSFEVILFNPETGNRLATMDVPGLPNSIAFSPDSRLIVAVSSQGVYVYNTQSRARVAELTGHSDWVKSVAFSPDGTLFATAADDATVRIWGLP